MRPFLLFATAAFGLISFAFAAEPVRHELSVHLQPATAELVVSDIVTLPPSAVTTRYFNLQTGLTITEAQPAVQRIDDGTTAANSHIRYAVQLAPGQRRITLRYRGKINLPPEQINRGFGRDQQASSAYIGVDGVYLDGSSAWYPVFDDNLLRFSLDVDMPAGWRALSQGTRSQHDDGKMQAHDRWEEQRPQEEIYLVAAPFHEYDRDGTVKKQVLLREEDAALADNFLGVMDNYINLYSGLIGPYPYGKFALVENSWESGYGMPSFTLLGPRVIRLPFILHSSFPHEILHNWWGNGVYVDASDGNWSEGLTAYLADHALAEQNGRGAAYRRDALLRYTNYVAEQADFPLSQFRMRHSEATQAVGYDKALMFFHALRLQLGDVYFVAALRHFYQDELFHFASWNDLRRAFEREAKTSLRTEFQQWLQRTGAPTLRVRAARALKKGDGYVLRLELEQMQSGAAYRLRIPISVAAAGHKESIDRVVAMQDKQLTTDFALPARPWRVAVDPEYDVFRRLDPAELPPTLSEALGAERLLIVLPSAAPPAQRDGYMKLARGWAEGADRVEVTWDNKLNTLPSNRAVWLFGWENHFRSDITNALAEQDATLSSDKAHIVGADFTRAEQAVILATRRGGQPLIWLGVDNITALPGLARKLPHYGSASYLAFRGDEPSNVLKGQWQVLNSPLTVNVAQPDGASAPGDAVANLHPRPSLLQSVHALPKK